ncbi:MAG: hypothetical protein KZQ63_06980 [Candidatus Thiodiazotropha sp. (ex Lucinoma aequizonata)]|nr:hypothetical protein [Candidatus Thiodiazotropha sp. (ex Lucinoma aequizonata)]
MTHKWLMAVPASLWAGLPALIPSLVNEIEFETDNASFTVNDVNGTQSNIAIGMVVRINGNSDQTTATGSAKSVEYDSLIEGLIQNNDIASNNTLTIMDQVITIDADTVYENPFQARLQSRKRFTGHPNPPKSTRSLTAYCTPTVLRTSRFCIALPQQVARALLHHN